MSIRTPWTRRLGWVPVAALVVAGAASATPALAAAGTTLSQTVSANAHLTRTFHWTIGKTADPATLDLFRGDSSTVNYTVTLTKDTGTVRGWIDGQVCITNGGAAATQGLASTINVTRPPSTTVIASTPLDVSANPVLAAGQITVHNPAPIDATINTVTDVVGAIGAKSVDCGVTFPYTLAAGADLVCTYTVDLPDASGGTNTATATLQNTPSGTTDFTGTAPVDFSTATINSVDAAAALTDTYSGAGLPSTVNASDTPATYTYTRTVGPYGTPGSYTVDNTATVTGKDTGKGDSSSVSIPVTVNSGGCTLTIGYWKNHPDQITPLLPIWLGIPGGMDSVEVTTSSQAVTILGIPEASNGIDKLYAQLLAAKLDIANGADGSAVASTVSAADAFLATHTTGGWSTLSGTDQTQVNNWATTLDNYNSGLIGPGHCSS